MWFTSGVPEVSEAINTEMGIRDRDDDYLYIATNNHVVADSEELTVQFDDDSVVKAEIRGTDPDDDLAVVSVKKADLGKDNYSNIKIACLLYTSRCV